MQSLDRPTSADLLRLRQCKYAPVGDGSALDQSNSLLVLSPLPRQAAEADNKAEYYKHEYNSCQAEQCYASIDHA
jgi:hypothetical protein